MHFSTKPVGFMALVNETLSRYTTEYNDLMSVLTRLEWKHNFSAAKRTYSKEINDKITSLGLEREGLEDIVVDYLHKAIAQTWIQADKFSELSLKKRPDRAILEKCGSELKDEPLEMTQGGAVLPYHPMRLEKALDLLTVLTKLKLVKYDSVIRKIDPRLKLKELAKILKGPVLHWGEYSTLGCLTSKPSTEVADRISGIVALLASAA